LLLLKKIGLLIESTQIDFLTIRTYPGVGYFGITEHDPTKAEGGVNASKTSKSACFYSVCRKNVKDTKLGMSIDLNAKTIAFYLNGHFAGTANFDFFTTEPMLVAFVGESDSTVSILPL
jgi:hypothetical protein